MSNYILMNPQPPDDTMTVEYYGNTGWFPGRESCGVDFDTELVPPNTNIVEATKTADGWVWVTVTDRYQRAIAMHMLQKLQDRAFNRGKMQEYRILWHCWNLIFWDGLSRTSYLKHKEWLEGIVNG